MAGVSGQKGLNFGGKFDISEILKNQQKIVKGFNDIKKASGGMTARDFDTKPMTAYQQAMVKAKEDALALAKAKQEQAAADKSASLVLQKALADERLAREAINTATAKNRLEMSEAIKLAREQAAVVKKLNDEAAKSKPSKNRDFSVESQSQNALASSTARATSIVSAQVVARAKLSTEIAKQAAQEGNLRANISGSTSSTQSQIQATQSLLATKKQLAQQLILEKATQQAAQAALKAYTLEQAAAKGSIEQRKLALDRLKLSYSQLNDAERRSSAGMRLATVIGGLTDQIKKLDSATKGSISSLKSQEGIFTTLKGQLLGVAAGYASFAAAAAAGKAIVHTNAEVSDSMADVQRTVKLTSEQTDGLVDSLKKLDRRTNLTALLDIGYIGGQLGVGKKDIQGYIEKIDELGVVLKKEFPGGAEAVAISLGKLNSIYKITATQGITLEKSLSKIGSALLGIAHDGPVNVQYLQDFALRTAGVAQVAKLSLPVMLAYGAVLSEAGVTAQVAASSVNRLISSIAGKREKYFAIAQLADSTLTIEKFTNLINTDTKSALDLFFKGLKSGNPTQTEFNDRMSTLNFRVGAATNSITALALNQEKLSRKIEIGSDEYDRASLSAENYEIKNNTLAASIDKVGNAISNITTDPNSGLGKALKFIIDATTDAIHALDNLFSSMSKYTAYDKFWDRIQVAIYSTKAAEDRINADNKFKAGLAARSRIEARRDEVSAQGTIQAKDLIDKNRTEEQLKRAIKIEEDLFKSYYSQRQNALKYLLDPANTDEKARKSVEEKSKKLMDILFRQKVKLDLIRNSFTGQFGAVQKQEGQEEEIIDVASIKKEIKSLTEANIKLNNTGKQFEINVKRIRELRKQLKEAGGGVDNSGIRQENAFEAMAKRRNALQKEITEQIEISKRKQLSADDEEVESVSKKYNDLRFKANEYFKDLEKKTPKERAKLGLTLSGLDTAEISDKQVIIDKQSNDRLKKRLDDEGKLFQQFEAYKEKLGMESAQKRFKGEFTTAEEYGKKLENLQTKLLSEITDPASATEAQKDELAIIKGQIDVLAEYRKSKQDSVYEEAVSAAMTNAQILTQIDIDYQRRKTALGENATAAQLLILSKNRDAQIRAQNEANAVAMSGYDDLMMNFNKMTRVQIEERLNAIKEGYRKEYREGKLTAEQLSALINPIDNQLSELGGNNPFNKISSAIKKYKDAIDDFGKGSEGAKRAQKGMFDAISEGAGQVNSALGVIASTLGDLGIGGEGLQAAFKSISGVVDGIGQISKGIADKNPIAIVTGSIKLLSSAIELFNVKDKRLQKRIDNYKAQLDNLGNAYKQLERDVSSSVGESIYTNQASQIDNLRQQQELLIKQRDAESSKKKTDQKKVDEYNNAINEIPGKIEDINKAISENLIQTNFRDLSNNLADALTDAFKTGEDSAKAFDDVFKNVIANAIKNSLKLKILDPIIKKFTDDLASYAKGNGNSVIGFDFDSYKKQLEDAGKLFSGALKGSEEFFKGIDDKKGGNENSLVGSIKKDLTEETGSILAGAFNGMRLSLLNIEQLMRPMAANQATMITLAQRNLNEIVLIQQNTYRAANNTDQLSRLESVEERLGVIAKNTGDTLGVQLRAAGKFSY